MTAELMTAPSSISRSGLSEGPWLVGFETPFWTTSKALVLDPVIINDNNLYYRALGFRWPFRGITRAMLRRAYRRRAGVLQNSPWAEYCTYALSQLLDKGVRRKYDRAPFGNRLIDKYVWEEFHSAAQRAASDAAREGVDLSVAEQMTEWGLPTEPISAASNEPVADPEAPLGDDDLATHTWDWGYYTWRSSCSDRDRLARWQDLLLRAADGLVLQLAVGFVGRVPQGFVLGRVGAAVVVFLHDGIEPDEGSAARAVEAVIHMINE